MKIKRYMADSMRAALAQVRAEQGPDAVILSSRRVEEGIEVIAAVDYDEALFADATLRRAPIAPPEPAQVPTPAPETVSVASRRLPVAAMPASAARLAPAPRLASAARVSPAPRLAGTQAAGASLTAAITPVSTAAVASAPPGAPSVQVALLAQPSLTLRTQEGDLSAMQREVRDLREMLQGELAHMSWNDKRLRDPLQARVLEELTALDIAPDVAQALANRVPRSTTLGNPAHLPLALLVKHLPVVDDVAAMSGGVIALVGPTGAGKTTTIAKLAARWSMQHGSKDLALVSTDGYRIGAREQLMTYARILGAPMHVANNGKELARVLERLKSKKLVLIDTAGMGPRDVRLSEQLAALQLGAARARVLLALPSQGEAHALEEIVKSFASVAPTACILTKVDEAASLGAVVSTTIRHKLPIAYLCTGQRVPEDLHPAQQRKVWLMQLALKLKDRALRPPVNENYLARHFGRASTHA